ncbi:protein kinase [Streptomyces sp. NPDC091272]|uniref:protein kinase domain-containing protein n=1 Tax=Streptomyces sp. NPDC091272 TaxID=3365981 RepID=UPI00382A1728
MAMEKLGPSDPRHIGDYRLLARLGAGGMGQVFLARSDRGRTVAVKLVRRELAEQEEFRSRFRQEVQAARRVGGHWTAPVLDADTEAEVPWVATGYVAGPTLQQVVSGGHGPLPERSVLVLAAGLTRALQDIHAAGLIHRDLKPSNVLVTIDGPRVIDFGIARALETVTDSGLTRTGALVGSPGFMAPEQIRGDRVTTACDVFCLGSVLSYAATGRLPFGTAHSGVHALMFRIAQEPPDLADVPESLHDLIRDCLQKPPAARPALDRVLARTGPAPAAGEPWLPATLVAQLGIHAVQLLDLENPTTSLPAGALPPAEPAANPPGTPEAQAGDPPGTSEAQAADPPGAPESRAGGAGAQEPAGPPAAPGTPGGGGGVHSMPTVVVGTPPAAPGGPPAPGVPRSPGTPPPPQSPAQSPLPALPPTASGPYAYPNQQAQQGGYGYPGHQQAQPGGYGYPDQQQPQPGGGYGYPNQPPPQPAAGYGYPNQQPQYGSYGYTYPGGGVPGSGPGSSPEPSPRSNRATFALIAVALVVALGAGGSVYAFMRGGDDSQVTDAGASGSPTSPRSAASSPAEGSGSPGSSSAPGSSGAPATAGTVPGGFLGTWRGTVAGDAGTSTRGLTLRQGETGDTVMSLTADGPAGSGSYHCLFEAELTSVTPPDGPVHLGPSRVVVGPTPTCTPGRESELVLLPDGRMRRTTADNKSVTYTKSG